MSRQLQSLTPTTLYQGASSRTLPPVSPVFASANSVNEKDYKHGEQTRTFLKYNVTHRKDNIEQMSTDVVKQNLGHILSLSVYCLKCGCKGGNNLKTKGMIY